MVDPSDSAISLTSNGYHCYPVTVHLDNTGKKTPTFPSSGWKDGNYPTDPGDIREHFAGYTGIAINTGRSGLVVIDVDTSNGKDGFAALKAKGITLPDTPTVAATPNGGSHFYYRAGDHGIRCSQSVLADGVDVRADGGIAYAPPTVVDGLGTYTFTRGPVPVEDLPVLPADLAELLSRTPAERRTDVDPVRALTDAYGASCDSVRRVLDTWLGRLRGIGRSRHNTMLQGQTALVGQGMAGHSGVLSALDEFRAAYIAAVPDRDDADTEYDRAVAGAWENAPQPTNECVCAASVDDAVAKRADAMVIEMLARERAKARIAEREIGTVAVPAFEVGTDYLTNDSCDTSWIVDGLWPAGGKVLVSAPAKTGKTSLMLNVIESLTTGSEFLGSPEFQVGKSYRVALIDTEMSKGQHREWLKDVPGVVTDNIVVMNALGQASALDVTNPAIRSVLAERLRGVGAEVLLLDPISPVLSAMGADESSPSEVRRLLDCFDALAAEAELDGVLITHHTGHDNQGRPRGGSPFLDWPSALWNLQRNTSGVRTFNANGRDVAVGTTELVFDPVTRRYSIGGGPLAAYVHPWIQENRHRAVTIPEATNGMNCSDKTARGRLESDGWENQTTARGAGKRGKWVNPVFYRDDPFAEVG